MASYNKVLLMGNLTRDPELKYTPKGTAVTDIGLACNRTFQTESGEKREEVTFVDITVMGRQAETVSEYCRKGRPIFVEGRLQLDQWDDKQTGQKRSKLKVMAERVQFLGVPQKGEGDGDGEGSGGEAPAARPPRAARPAAPARAAAPVGAGASKGSGDGSAEDDDIPF